MELWLKSLNQNIIISCKEEGITVSSELTHFLIQLLLLNPNYESYDGKIDADIITKIIKEKLCNKFDISLITIKMQHYFIKYFECRDEIINKHRQRLKQKIKPLMKEICEVNVLGEEKSAQKMYYQKIMTVITLLSGLGKPTIPSVLREVEMASQSVFQQSELSQFLALSCSKKEEYLIELMCIVAGIRIFNKDCKRGGEGIADLPQILEKVTGGTEATIVVLLEDIMNSIYKYTTAVEQFLPCIENKVTLNDKNELFFTRAVNIITHLRQEEVYLRKILTEIGCSKKLIKNLLKHLRGRLLQLHETLLCASVIPTSRVYPQFVDLADIWLKLQDEVIVLNQINNFLLCLQSLCVTANVNEDEELNQIIEGIDIITDADRFNQSMDKLIVKCTNCHIIYPYEKKDFDKLKLEFVGFCPSTFVLGKGVLIPGNPNIGIAEWQGKYFAFSSPEAAAKFGEDPNQYFSEALYIIRTRPEFIYLFQMYDTVKKLCNIKQLTEESQVQHEDQETQTDVHILQPYIDRKYSSSLWEYRKRALQLVKICQSSTKSTQTINSHFRNEFQVQVAPPENKKVQTKVDSSTNTAKIVSHIIGFDEKSTDE